MCRIEQENTARVPILATRCCLWVRNPSPVFTKDKKTKLTSRSLTKMCRYSDELHGKTRHGKEKIPDYYKKTMTFWRAMRFLFSGLGCNSRTTSHWCHSSTSCVHPEKSFSCSQGQDRQDPSVHIWQRGPCWEWSQTTWQHIQEAAPSSSVETAEDVTEANSHV